MGSPVAQMPITSGQVEPFDHSGFGVVRSFPLGELVGFETVVHDHLSRSSTGGNQGGTEEFTLVVVYPDLFVIGDPQRCSILVIDHHMGRAAVVLQHEMIGRIERMNTPTVVSAGYLEGIVATNLWGFFVPGQMFVRFDKPGMFDQELGATGEGWPGFTFLHVIAEGCEGLIRLGIGRRLVPADPLPLSLTPLTYPL